ncbi:MAG TPA: hypothetical protein PK640_18900 [Verrucomicrobiota bacterium]|nr:hypothetical protein [Verrucomicrobiota bacterium]
MKTIIALFLSLGCAACAQTSPNITVPRGDRITLRFLCQYPDGTPVDVTGWEAEAAIRASVSGATVTNYAETAGAGGTNGLLSWSWDVGLLPGRYLLGFRWITDDGITFTPLPRAPFTVLPSLLAPTNGETVAGGPPSRGGEPREWVFTSLISPTGGNVQSLAVNVGLRGPAGATGATGPAGPAASTNGLVGADSLGALAWSNSVSWTAIDGEPTLLVPGDTNWFVTASITNGLVGPSITNGLATYASLGTLAWSNSVSWVAIDGEPTFLIPGDTNGFVTASITNGLGGGAAPAAGPSLTVLSGSNNPPYVWSNLVQGLQFAATNVAWTNGGSVWINGVVNCVTDQTLVVVESDNPGVVIRGTNGASIQADLSTLVGPVSLLNIAATNWGMEGLRVLAYSAASDNQRLFQFSGHGTTIRDVAAAADGANDNLCCAIDVESAVNTTVRRCIFTIGEGAGAGCSPVMLYNCTTGLVESCAIDTQYINLDGGSGLVFENCYVIGRHASAGALHNLPDGSVLNGCRLVSAGGGPTLHNGGSATVYGNLNFYTNSSGVTISGMGNVEWGETDFKPSWVIRALGVK